jgi:hypothetical protein
MTKLSPGIKTIEKTGRRDGAAGSSRVFNNMNKNFFLIEHVSRTNNSSERTKSGNVKRRRTTEAYAPSILK